MTDEVQAFDGLGFSISKFFPEEREDFQCNFHKLDEERDSHPCLEAAHVFVELAECEEGMCMCAKHFALFGNDMIAAIHAMVPPDFIEETPQKLTHKEGSVLTYSGMVELVMVTKDHLNGRNA